MSLADGLETRLRPYTTVVAKPPVSVGGRPVVGHIVRSLRSAGVRRIVLCVSYLGELSLLYLLQLEIDFAFHREGEVRRGPSRSCRTSRASSSS